ncbi:hypothetical protein [uncultured Thiodictyon sp.]|uniref:hypothetical protein n=1 Tax=uncultured Thiodictyon sp. TaxID=1846217 RepID=UPI0025EA3AFB|nr:hypothetical protein [uncultured Thiodictyon sp.]
MTTTLRSLLFMISLALGVMQLAVAAVPKTLTYQGTLTDGAGQPVSGSKTITLSLYTVATAGTAFWTETQTLTLADGRLSVVLGNTPGNLLDPSKFTGETYIGIRVGTDTEMPRQPFSSVAYAFQAGDGGVPKGGIIMWSGAVDAVPAGWALCNGQNSTPDLRGRFIVGGGGSYLPGGTGGVESNSVNHSHSISAESPEVNWAGDHQHSVNLNTSGANGTFYGVDWDHTPPDLPAEHSHNINGNTAGAGGHSHTVNSHAHGGATGTAATNILDNRPPYYALAFIMKL